MRPDKQYVEKKYREYNDMCFGGKLPMLPVRMSTAKTFLGAVRFKKKKDFWGRLVYYDFELVISVKYDLPEREVEDTIIHEMIHFYIYYNKLKDTSTHGTIFRKMMNEINARYGRHITISHKNDAAQTATDVQKKVRVICVTELQNGERGVTICARTRVFEINRNIPKYYKIKSMTWYVSMNPFFGRYPNSITPKIYKISATELDSALVGAVKMKFDGNVFRRE